MVLTYPNGKSFSGNSVYVEGARYTGSFGVGAGSGGGQLGDLQITNTTISTVNSGDDIVLQPSTGIIDMDTDTALVLPMVQMQKDPTGVEGMIRYNEDSDKVEVYDGTDWTQVGGSNRCY